MTYKHTDLSNSVVGQALLKIAVKQGLITPEKSEKFRSVADVQQELTAFEPTSSMPENLLKLCSGLRQKGLTSYADTLESKFLQYKQAENALYDVHKETGEDVINQAHPAGSHAMENLEGDATIETILDRSKKIQDAVLKEPTGKLATKDVLNVVRILLAQKMNLLQTDQQVANTMTPDQINNGISQYWSDAKSKWQRIDQIIREKGKLSYVPGLGRGMDYWGLASGVNDRFEKTPDLDTIDELKKYIKDGVLNTNIKSLVSPGWSGGISHEAWKELGDGADFDALYDDITWVGTLLGARILQQRQQEEHPTQSAPTTNPVVDQYNALLQKVYNSDKINKDGKIAINDWIQKNKPDFSDPQAAQKIKDIEQSLINKGLI